MDWGLQVSWFIALLIFIFYPVSKYGKFRYVITSNFKHVSIYFFIVITLTLVSILLRKWGVIQLTESNESNLLSRSISHTVYLIFEYLLFVYIYVYLQDEKNHLGSLRFFISYPFFFITIWGIYQWLTTFDLLSYIDVFNNSLSTKFTYLRFKDAHRTASVFPEPSEYAYFLSFMIPFAIHLYYKPKSLIFISKSKYFIILLAISIILCASMSLFLVLPIILIYALRDYVKFKLKHFFLMISLLGIVLAGIIFLQNDRILDILGGNDGSAIIRYEAFEETLSLFKASPFLGVGFGAVRGLDLFSFLLGTTGIVGTLAFFKMIISLKAYSSINSLFLKALKCMLIVALISNPIIDLTFFWPILAFISVPIKV